ncbi:inositol monophosphatase [Candidatus Pelagibacter bacterium]|nr:inositol monophosphatase [Candidatus Pelagibacter bacterium]
MISISANLNIMIKATEKASKTLIRDFGELEKLQVLKKSPNDFFNNSNLKAKKIILDELTKARPYYSILCDKEGLKYHNDKDNIWIIDPISGSLNFLHGIPHFAISIALQSKNEIVSGLIFDPIKNELFYAERNNGSFLNNKRIRVSKKNEINECLFATGDKLNFDQKIMYRKSGSAALDMAYVASGRYDGYFEKDLNLWDIAAGIILVIEAGGVMNKIDLKNFNNIKILTSSPEINVKLTNTIVNN